MLLGNTEYKIRVVDLRRIQEMAVYDYEIDTVKNQYRIYNIDHIFKEIICKVYSSQSIFSEIRVYC